MTQKVKWCEVKPTICTCSGNKDKCKKNGSVTKAEHTPVGFNVKR